MMVPMRENNSIQILSFGALTENMLQHCSLNASWTIRPLSHTSKSSGKLELLFFISLSCTSSTCGKRIYSPTVPASVIALRAAYLLCISKEGCCHQPLHQRICSRVPHLSTPPSSLEQLSNCTAGDQPATRCHIHSMSY